MKMTDKEKLDYIALLYYNHISEGYDNIDEFFNFLKEEGLVDSDNELNNTSRV